MPKELTNRVIIITGASSGIGAATAIACAKAGMDVVVNARRAHRLQETAQQIRSLGRQAEVVAGDVAEPGISERMLDAAMSRFGRFDVVFANAGYGLERAVVEITMAELRAMFDVNFFAAVDLLQNAAKRLIDQQRPGHLLMCSSCLSKFTTPYGAPYCATKAAQNHICRGMRIELRPHRIEVASVHPIGTKTEFSAAADIRSGFVHASDPSEVMSQGDIPRLFMQRSERVANAVVRCLRHPRPEVWTSFAVRLGMGLATIWPGLAETAMRQIAKRRNAARV